jgi:hypothetical protein
MCIRRETREKARQSLAFSPVSKPHTHIIYMLRQCTSIVHIFPGCENMDSLLPVIMYLKTISPDEFRSEWAELTFVCSIYN